MLVVVFLVVVVVDLDLVEHVLFLVGTARVGRVGGRDAVVVVVVLVVVRMEETRRRLNVSFHRQVKRAVVVMLLLQAVVVVGSRCRFGFGRLAVGMKCRVALVVGGVVGNRR